MKKERGAYQLCTTFWILHLITQNFHCTPLLKSNPLYVSHPYHRRLLCGFALAVYHPLQNKLSYIKLATERGNSIRRHQWHTGHILSRERSVVLLLHYTPLVPHERETLGDFIPPLLIRTRFPFTFLSRFSSIYAYHHHQRQTPLRML